ncbi:PspC domain-containing protein [Thioalkalivibrio sp. XN8]|uniref:PspC domain-containing protein n=1 Tax=Thioalkalivibrio sp. XN8 TaxID=2712863 RepID=UPI0013ED11E8|nr:PspC domain-containing protein [Thioalkalivibrio sp. XN8]NGP52579.1 PspC domain-containing protein [Thioalkalivibrio sp. XN8]
MNRGLRSLRSVRLYRDSERGMVMGVCAGLSDQFGFRLGPLRIITLVSLLLFTLPTLLVYVAAGLLLPDKPLRYYGSRDERDLWGSRSGRMEA